MCKSNENIHFTSHYYSFSKTLNTIPVALSGVCLIIMESIFVLPPQYHVMPLGFPPCPLLIISCLRISPPRLLSLKGRGEPQPYCTCSVANPRTWDTNHQGDIISIASGIKGLIHLNGTTISRRLKIA